MTSDLGDGRVGMDTRRSSQVASVEGRQVTIPADACRGVADTWGTRSQWWVGGMAYTDNHGAGAASL
jgi:hypothetical protein